MPTVPPEPGPEATFQEYCAYLTDVLNLRTVDQLTAGQAIRYMGLQNSAYRTGVAVGRAAPTKDEPDQ